MLQWLAQVNENGTSEKFQAYLKRELNEEQHNVTILFGPIHSTLTHFKAYKAKAKDLVSGPKL